VQRTGGKPGTPNDGARKLGAIMRKILFGLALAAAIATTSGGAAAEEKLYIDSQVWGFYQVYLRNISNGTKPGAFAVSKDGGSAFYSWCQDIRCMAGPTYSHEAKTACEREYGTECVVFAIRDEIKVEYEVVGNAQISSAAPAATEPAPVTRITVTPDVKAEIDSYLGNARRAGLTWALAIAKDGSRVETASCQVSARHAVNGSCSPVAGDMQDLTSREALKQCGGADECVLLYAGEKKLPNIDIVVSAVDTKTNDEVATAPSAAAPLPEIEPAPVTTITVTPDVKAEIDRYLGNTENAGRVWAFAIAKDGSDAAMASCPASGSYSGGNACEPVKGSAQELAKREAIKRCGGAADCMLLYIGATKAANVEVVVQ
jgi:hypothetical protein